MPSSKPSSKKKINSNLAGKVPETTVGRLLADKDSGLDVELLSGHAGLNNIIRVPSVQKPGLALAGCITHVRAYRVQLLGLTEMEYIGKLNSKELETSVRTLFSVNAACFVVAQNLEIPSIFIEEADRTNTPLLRTKLRSSAFVEIATKFLHSELAVTMRLHGVLVDVMEVGILLLGESGIGKSECAMDLILQGNRLVADDLVCVRKISPTRIVGRGEDLIQFHVEIRGIGILNIQDLFGVTSVREEKTIELVIEFVHWENGIEYERLGFDENTYSILDVEVPYLKLPVRPGRNMASVVEIAARNHMLKRMGHNSAIRLKERLEAAAEKNS